MQQYLGTDVTTEELHMDQIRFFSLHNQIKYVEQVIGTYTYGINRITWTHDVYMISDNVSEPAYHISYTWTA